MLAGSIVWCDSLQDSVVRWDFLWRLNWRFFICSTLVSEIWAESSENVSENHLHISLIYYIIVIFIVILTGAVFYWEIVVESKCLWLIFTCKIMTSIVQHSQILSPQHYFCQKASVLIYICTRFCLLNTITSYDIHNYLTLVDNVPGELRQ